MMVPERRYAAWNGAYRGAPTPTGTYYFITLFCVCAAASLRFLPNLSSILFVPFNMAGVVFRLYKPVIRRRVRSLRDLPAASPQYAVRISLSRGTIYGTDEGLVSFVDGWLLFVGAGCTFSFRTCDVLPSPAESKLTFAAPSQTHALVFEYEERGFDEAWIRWRSESSPPTGLVVLPPVVPLPRKAEWNHALTAVLLGIASFLIAFHSPVGIAVIASLSLLLALLFLKTRRFTADALARIAAGKPARRSSWSILGESIILEKIGEAIRAALRRRRRRRGLVRRVRTP